MSAYLDQPVRTEAEAMAGLPMTQREFDLIWHATGGHRRAGPFRNHFAASPEGDDDKVWLGLVARGYASGPRNGAAFGSLNFYYVTSAGKEAAQVYWERTRHAS